VGRFFGIDGVEILKCRGSEKKLRNFHFIGIDEKSGEEFDFRVKAMNENQVVARVAREAKRRLDRGVFFQNYEVFEEKKEKIPSH
jgi:hypothetical protein